MKNPEMDERGILFIAYYFPPLQSIGVWRNYFLANEASFHFEKVFVSGQKISKVTVFNDQILKQFERIENIVIDYRTIFQKKDNISFKEDLKKNFVSQIFIKLINSFPFNLIIGEGGFLYIFHSLYQLNKLIKTEQIQYIYSSYRPMSDHVIAYWLKKLHPQLIWTADFRDLPFDPLYKNYFWEALQKWVLRRLLKSANLITSFTNGIAIGLKSYTPHSTFVLENGFFNLSAPIKKISQNPKFTIQYTGSLFLNERNPGPLLEVLRELLLEKEIDANAILLKYAGKDSGLWKQKIEDYQLSSITETLGLISNSEAKSLQVASHINVILTSSHAEYKGILTGKFFEYVLAGRPIICLVNGTKDIELEEIFQKYNLGLVIYDNLESKFLLKQFILKLYSKQKVYGEGNWTIDPEIFNAYNWKKTMNKWIKLLADERNT